MTIKAKWRPIQGWPYEVSDKGSVRRVKPASGTSCGILRYIINKSTGYPMVNLVNAIHRKHASVHRLVCAAFHGPQPSPRHQVEHLDGDRKNARASNLRWATVSQINDGKRRRGTLLIRDLNPAAKLTDALAREIRLRSTKGENISALSRRFGVSRTLIRGVINGIYW